MERKTSHGIILAESPKQHQQMTPDHRVNISALDEFAASLEFVAASLEMAAPHVTAEELALVTESRKFTSMLALAARRSAVRLAEADARIREEILNRPSGRLEQGAEGHLVSVPFWNDALPMPCTPGGRVYQLPADEGVVLWKFYNGDETIYSAMCNDRDAWRREKYTPMHRPSKEFLSWVDSLPVPNRT